MAHMQAVYYRDPGGREPVSDFIDELTPVAAQVAVDNQIDRLTSSSTPTRRYLFPTPARSRASCASCVATTAADCSGFSIVVRTGCSFCYTSSRRRPDRSPRRTRRSPESGGTTSGAGWTRSLGVPREQPDTTPHEPGLGIC